MQAFKRAGNAQKSASRKALRQAGVKEDQVKAVGVSYRRMSTTKASKGRTKEEQERIHTDNAALAAAARKNTEALMLEQQARKRALRGSRA